MASTAAAKRAARATGSQVPARRRWPPAASARRMHDPVDDPDEDRRAAEENIEPVGGSRGAARFQVGSANGNTGRAGQHPRGRCRSSPGWRPAPRQRHQRHRQVAPQRGRASAKSTAPAWAKPQEPGHWRPMKTVQRARCDPHAPGAEQSPHYGHHASTRAARNTCDPGSCARMNHQYRQANASVIMTRRCRPASPPARPRRPASAMLTAVERRGKRRKENHPANRQLRRRLDPSTLGPEVAMRATAYRRSPHLRSPPAQPRRRRQTAPAAPHIRAPPGGRWCTRRVPAWPPAAAQRKGHAQARDSSARVDQRAQQADRSRAQPVREEGVSPATPRGHIQGDAPSAMASIWRVRPRGRRCARGRDRQMPGSRWSRAQRPQQRHARGLTSARRAFT